LPICTYYLNAYRLFAFALNGLLFSFLRSFALRSLAARKNYIIMPVFLCQDFLLLFSGKNKVLQSMNDEALY
jgi:hypothetical protein